MTYLGLVRQGRPIRWIKRSTTWVVMGTMLLLLSGSRILYGITGEDIVQKVQKRYAKANGLSLQFERAFQWKLADQVQRSKGLFYLRKPNCFRLETASQTTVTDGKTMWIYIPSNQQVLVEPYRKEQPMSGPENVLNLFFEDYVPAYVRDERVRDNPCHVLSLQPRESGSYIREVTVWVDPKIWFVRRVRYVDLNGDTTTYELTSLEVDPKLDDRAFVFEIPEGVDVVDMR